MTTFLAVLAAVVAFYAVVCLLTAALLWIKGMWSPITALRRRLARFRPA